MDENYRQCPLFFAALLVNDKAQPIQELIKISGCAGSVCAWYDRRDQICALLSLSYSAHKK